MTDKVKVKVPKRSGFDKSHQNLLTTKCGTLTPVLVDELIPNSHVNLDAAVSAALPPLASDTFMRCDLKMEAFFVPTRILYGGYESWLTNEKLYDADEDTDVDVLLPTLQVTNTNSFSALTAAGTLYDYLGGKKLVPSASATSIGNINIFPFLAYYKIYDDWYRNTQVQRPLFSRDPNTFNTGTITCLPYELYTSSPASNSNAHSLGESFGLNSAYTFGQLMQRNFGLDYFTIATPKEQMGDAQKVTFATNGATGNFTIAALRAANSLQQFAERNALGGVRMQDFVKNQYGADLSSGVAQRALYLGSTSFNVYSKGIYQNANGDGGVQVENPFSDSVGAEFGSARATGEGNLVKDFTTAEPGYLMVIASLVPKVTYSSGLSRLLARYNTGFRGDITDMANPLLQNIGNQPIFQYELVSDKAFNAYEKTKVFGFTERFADWKYMPDELHGLVRDGESLESFALQRTLSGDPIISSEFLEIPTNYLDQVAAVNGTISKYGCWFDSYFKYHVSMPLAEYSIPSLQDPAYEHGNDVSIDIRGSRL